MVGNVAEWIHSHPLPGPVDWTGTERKGLRGGSVWTPTSGLRSSARYHYGIDTTTPKVGFRVARTIPNRPFLGLDPEDLLTRIEIWIGPAACPPELSEFAGERVYDDPKASAHSTGRLESAECPRAAAAHQKSLKPDRSPAETAGNERTVSRRTGTSVPT